MSFRFPRHKYQLICASDISMPQSQPKDKNPGRTIGSAVIEGPEGRHILCTVFPEHFKLRGPGCYELYMVFLVLESLPEEAEVLYYVDQNTLYDTNKRCRSHHYNKIHNTIQAKRLKVTFVRGRGHLDYHYCDYVCDAYREEILTTRKQPGVLHVLKWEQGSQRKKSLPRFVRKQKFKGDR